MIVIFSSMLLCVEQQRTKADTRRGSTTMRVGDHLKVAHFML